MPSQEVALKDNDQVLKFIHELVLRGQPWSDVYDEVWVDYPDLPKGAILDAYNHYLVNKREYLSYEAKLQLELDRLDALQAAAWDNAMDGQMYAIREVLKIMQHRAKLLGMDVPKLPETVTSQQVLVIGQDQQSFLEALRKGREEGTKQLDQ